MRVLYSILLLVIVSSCSPTTQLFTSLSSSYEEDLSQYRPAVPKISIEEDRQQTANVEEVEYVEPTEHLRAEIDSILRIKVSRNLDIGYLQGFTIQVYTGRSRERANNAKRVVYKILIDEEVKVYYDQPMFRVKVGRYYTRLEAEKSFNQLRKRFPQALVLPERIPLQE